jgi:hypothetical protein
MRAKIKAKFRKVSSKRRKRSETSSIGSPLRNDPAKSRFYAMSPQPKGNKRGVFNFNPNREGGSED